MSSKSGKYFGLVYVKHGRVGTRSEGPDYYLQTGRGDLLLHYEQRNLWEPDYKLEFFARQFVEVEGKLTEQDGKESLQVEHVRASHAHSVISHPAL
ncbi:MAG: hypothetical protein IPI49_20515 [Myxococcales bacterium]|nr:hypothetical protein [Myxococcales bacterium]